MSTSNCQAWNYWRLLRRSWWGRQLKLLVSWSVIVIIRAHPKLISRWTQSLMFEIQKCLAIIFNNLIPIFICFFYQIIYINLQEVEVLNDLLFNKSNLWISWVLFSLSWSIYTKILQWNATLILTIDHQHFYLPLQPPYLKPSVMAIEITRNTKGTM